MAEFVVKRTVQISPNLTVELHVSRSTVQLWGERLPQQTPLLHAFAAGRALREAYDLLEARGILEGRWRVSWTGNRVDVEASL